MGNAIMNQLNNIDNLIAQAMVNKDTNRLNVLRLIKSNFVKFIKDNKFGELNETNQTKILLKMVSQCEDSITQFEKAGRTDLIEQTNKEVEILNKYMPEQLSEEEVLKVIDDAFNELKPEKPSDMGKLMGFLTPKLKGKADMSFVSKTIKEKLANL